MGHSRKKMKIEASHMPEWDGKLWVRVEMLNSRRWVPSFHDLYRIIRAICYCEDKKYPPPLKGRKMVEEFLTDAVWCPPNLRDDGYAELARKYKIPERCDVGVDFGEP